jgi:hypothetical protein
MEWRMVACACVCERDRETHPSPRLLLLQLLLIPDLALAGAADVAAAAAPCRTSSFVSGPRAGTTSTSTFTRNDPAWGEIDREGEG